MSKATIQNKIIGLRDLRENTEEYINAIKQGREYTVVKKGDPVFKIVPVDVWGDDGLWETVLDFTKLKSGGVDINDFSKAIDGLL